jgi:hypothetical protein
MAGPLKVVVKGDASDAISEVEKLGKATKSAGDDIDKMGDKGKKAGKDISSGLKDAKSEAGQSGREAAASFSGGFADVGDFVQETLANALSGFGPAGAAAGIALAAVVGTLMANAVATQEALAESRQRAATLAAEMYQNGGPLPITERVGELFDLLATERPGRNTFESLLNDFVDLGTNLDVVKKAAKEAGINTGTFLKALTGTNIGQTAQALKVVEAALAGIDRETGGDYSKIAGRRDALVGLETQLRKVIDADKLATELANNPDFVNAKRVEDLTAAWRDATGAVSDYMTADENGGFAFDITAYLADMENQIARAAELKTDLVGLPPEIRAEAERQWAENGVLMADSYVDTFQSASPDVQARMSAIASDIGKAAGTAGTTSFIDQATALALGWQPPQINIPVGLLDVTNPSQFRASVQANLGSVFMPVKLGPGWGDVTP